MLSKHSKTKSIQKKKATFALRPEKEISNTIKRKLRKLRVHLIKLKTIYSLLAIQTYLESHNELSSCSGHCTMFEDIFIKGMTEDKGAGVLEIPGDEKNEDHLTHIH
ncbi:hypothetical protein Leryth_012454 [Lithospermum erythrorhizon]|nr:hypothetical protein Leryth_012454 [Lithospermum erythrorhizon]